MMAATAKAKVFLVDDHPLVREMLKSLIEQQPDMTACGEAEDAAKALSSTISWFERNKAAAIALGTAIAVVLGGAIGAFVGGKIASLVGGVQKMVGAIRT